MAGNPSHALQKYGALLFSFESILLKTPSNPKVHDEDNIQ